jgi:hypothetical protein
LNEAAGYFALRSMGIVRGRRAWGGSGGCIGYALLEYRDDKIQRRRHPISPRALMAHPGILLKKRHFVWDMVRYGCSA